MNELLCSICNLEFNLEEKMPRLLPDCGHSFCQSCVEQLIKNSKEPSCPEDGKLVTSYTEYKGLSSFPLNYSLKKILLNKAVDTTKDNRINDYSGIQFCSKHKKVSDLICYSDLSVICSDCALFGDHKGHDFVKNDSFNLDFKNKFALLEKKYEELDSKLKNINNNENISFISNKVANFKERIKNSTTIQINEMIENLRKKETEIHSTIDNFFTRFNEAIEYLNASTTGLKERDRDIIAKITKLKAFKMNGQYDYRYILDILYGKDKARNEEVYKAA